MHTRRLYKNDIEAVVNTLKRSYKKEFTPCQAFDKLTAYPCVTVSYGTVDRTDSANPVPVFHWLESKGRQAFEEATPSE